MDFGFHFIREVPLISIEVIQIGQDRQRNPKKVLSFKFQLNQSSLSTLKVFSRKRGHFLLKVENLKSQVFISGPKLPACKESFIKVGP